MQLLEVGIKGKNTKLDTALYLHTTQPEKYHQIAW
jgi:hypothetical protein